MGKFITYLMHGVPACIGGKDVECKAFTNGLVTSYMDGVVVTALLLAIIGYVLPTLLRTLPHRDRWTEKLSTDPPEFDPKSTSAASLTAITSVTGGLLGAKLLPDPKDDKALLVLTHNFAFLGVFFATVVVIALALYYSSVTRRVWMYMVVDILLLWGAAGAVSTFAFLLTTLEVDASSKGTRTAFFLLVLVVVALMFYRRSDSTVQTVRDLALTLDGRKAKAIEQLTDTVRRLRFQRAAAHELIAAMMPDADPLTQQALTLASSRLAAAHILLPQFVTQAQQLASGYADMIAIAATAVVENAAVAPPATDGTGTAAPGLPSPATNDAAPPPPAIEPMIQSVHWKVG